MVRLKCPSCANVIDAPAGTSPTCPNCGFSASASAPARAAPAPTPFSAVEAPPASTLRPGWVTMVAVFQFIGAGFAILFGLLMVTIGGSLAAAINHPVADVFGSIAAIAGILLLAAGAFSIVLGINNLKGREWARVVSIVFSGISAALGLFSLVVGNFMAVFGLAIDILVIVGLSLPATRAWYAMQSTRGTPAAASA